MTSSAQPLGAGGSGGKPARQLNVIAPGGERVEPHVRGERALRPVDSLFQRLDALVQRFVPARMNPFAQTGAIANTTFIVACVSGVVLLIWYQTSVHDAYGSIVAMHQQMPWTAGLTRSIHRYSSDACMLFVLLHAVKLTAQRRFGGARWLAWVTGIFLVGTLWFVGWLGYWLVWDERGQQVALSTAQMLDTLPIFADPLSRSFLVDESVNSLLFFVVFFLHMLIPLLMGIALWLHITRLSRSHFLTKKWMTIWVLVSLVAVSLLFPADLAQPAEMAARPDRFTMDWWYLVPIVFADRLSAGALWAIVLVGGVLLFPLPWLLAPRRARVAKVETRRCNACEQCYQDCPYDAIQMVPRDDGRPYPTVAQIDPGKCVGCGICAGACEPSAIGLEWFDTVAQRKRMDRLIESSASPSAPMALVCAESAGADLGIDETTGECGELPGYRVVRVPCAGWVNALTLERVLRRGAPGVLVAACGPGGCRYREGGKWLGQRISGEREPFVRKDKVDAQRIGVVELFRTQRAHLIEAAKDFRKTLRGREPREPGRGRQIAAGLTLAVLLAGATWAFTAISYATPVAESPLLVVSFKHPGKAAEQCRPLTEEEKAKLPPHMQPKQVCERRRSDVRLRVEVDGKLVVDRAYEPRGIWNDGNSIAIEKIPVPKGRHQVRIQIGDSPDPARWDYEAEREARFEEKRNTVVLFDKLHGFQWHVPER